jgi:hypothetical protein
MQMKIHRLRTGNPFDRNRHLRQISLVAAFVFMYALLPGFSLAQVTLTDVLDGYVDSAAPTSNFGTRTTLQVGRSTVTQGQTTTSIIQDSFVGFDRSALSNISQGDIERATLKLYLNKVNTASPFGVYTLPVCNFFSEGAVTWNTRPIADSSVAVAISGSVSTGGQYVTIDLTHQLKAMLANCNFPIITFSIFPGGPSSLVFDSKESGGNPPTLDIELKRIRSVAGVDGLTGFGDQSSVLLSIADAGVTTQKLADSSVTSSKLVNGSVGSSQLGNNAVNSNHIAAGAINNLHLADNSVTSNKIGSGAVLSNHLGISSVTGSKLADGSVTTAKIAEGAVGKDQLGTGAVTANKIASGQVVTSLNGLTDSVGLIAGNNITITPSGNSLTITSTGVAQPASTPTYNPLQIALLRWWDVNRSEATFAVGNEPWYMAFDGSNVWVSNSADGTVTKLRTSDGANLGTFPVGPTPRAVAFDGKYIWVANFGGTTVSKLNATDGSPAGTIMVGERPWGLAFDGTYMWVSCWQSGTVSKIQASTNQIVGSVNVASPLGLAFDGTNIWAALNLGGGKVVKISGTGSPTVLQESPAGGFPGSVTYDGTSVWVSNSGTGDLTRFRASDGTNLGTYPGGGANNSGYTVFDGVNLWVAGGSLKKMRPSDGQVLATYPISGVGLVFDGANLWLTSAGANTVTKR